jgi:hypothetical protein
MSLLPMHDFPSHPDLPPAFEIANFKQACDNRAD